MQIKTKITFFIVVFFLILIIGYFLGVDFIGIAASILGVIGAIFAGKEIRKRDDRRGNRSGIDGELERARGANDREGKINSDERNELDRERKAIDDEKRDNRRDRELLEELQKRHPEG